MAYKIEKGYVIAYLHKEREGGDRRGKNNTTFPYMLDVRRVTFSLQIDFLLYETLWSCPFKLEPTLHIQVHTYILCVCAYYYMCVHAWRPLSISPVPTIYLVLHMSAHTFTCMWLYPFQLHVHVFASVSVTPRTKTLIFIVFPSLVNNPPPSLLTPTHPPNSNYCMPIHV